jgi:hypothetical protein
MVDVEGCGTRRHGSEELETIGLIVAASRPLPGTAMLIEREHTLRLAP